MLKKLRIQFVATVMASVAVVLAIVFSGICIAEYQRSVSDVQEALSSAIDRANEGLGIPSGASSGASSDAFRQGGWQGGSSSSQAAAGGLSEGASSEAAPPYGGRGEGAFSGPRIGGMDGGKRSLVPVAVYSVTSTESLGIVSGYTTAAIEDDVLSSAATRIGSLQDGSGTFDDLGLHYLKRTTETTTYVAFADTSFTTSWQTLARNLSLAAIVILGAFFVLALFLSKWALKPVKEAWDSQRQFVADASHELKTPLTVILANTSILLKHPESSIAQQSQWVESTQVEAESMQGLVNEMLELAQVESRSGIEKQDLDFSDLVDGEVLQFESVAFERGCAYEDDIAQGVRVSGDAAKLGKMTSTLIENALKYVDAGGTVSVRLSAEGKQATLAIHNTGSTIAPEDLPHIFDRFYRTDKARTSGEGGFGLGLAIARETAREHDGDITCASGPSGTTFTVTLPLA